MNKAQVSTNELVKQFNFYTNQTIDFIHQVCQRQLDSSATDGVFEVIERYAKLQRLAFNQILVLRNSPDEFDVKVLIVNFKGYLNTISYSHHLLRQGLLDGNATFEKLKIIESKAKLQMSLLDTLVN